MRTRRVSSGLAGVTKKRCGMRVALLGCGAVGSEIAHTLTAYPVGLSQRVGTEVELVGIAVRRPHARRIPNVPPRLFTTDPYALVTRDDVDVVIEVMGGIEPARSLLLTAMEHGSSVVTANKELLGENGASLHAAAEKHGVELSYEASVAGAIPLLRPLRESLAGDTVRSVFGIVNGTANYVLSRMDEVGASVPEALDEASALGYAEADPSADVEGLDAAAKAAILASLAFHTEVSTADVHREGITGVTPATVVGARRLGCTVKQLAICQRSDDGQGITVATHPTMVANAHPLATVRGAYNAVFVEAENAGQLMFYGQGAGGAPTSSALLGDLVVVARNRLAGLHRATDVVDSQLAVYPMEHMRTRCHVRLEVADQPGVLAQVAAIFASHGVSIATVHQEERSGEAQLSIVTHAARDVALSGTLADLRRLGAVRNVADVMRVLGE